MSDRVQELFQAKIRKVVLAYEGGKGLKSIAGQVGVSPPTISKWLTEEGYKRKKKGRVPLAMKARVRDLSQRGWDPPRIASLLQLDSGQVKEWSDAKRNPILGGEKDPLKVKGLRKRKKDKVKGRKQVRALKGTPKESGPWPPNKHKCRKHWTPLEKSYVLQLMEEGVKPLSIYRRMRASKRRQIRIWRESGGSGRPPNFPPPKDRPPGSSGPSLPPAEAAKRQAEVKALEAAGDERLRQLEEASARRQQRIAELEAAAAEEEEQIRLLEVEQKKLLVERREKAERLAQARAILEKKGAATVPRKRKVLPGSYEAEVEGLKPGTVVDPGRPGRPGLAGQLVEYADNGRYFVVSKEWADLDDASPDELSLFANHLISKKFLAKVEKTGDQPRAYFDSTWPDKVEDRWNKAVESGLELLEKYHDRKEELKATKGFSRGIANYLANSYTAYGVPALKGDKKKAAQEDALDDWARLKKIDRLILIFGMGASKPNGEPTIKGIERGRAAKILLERKSRSVAEKLGEKKQKATPEKPKGIRAQGAADRAAKRAAQQAKFRAILEGKQGSPPESPPEPPPKSPPKSPPKLSSSEQSEVDDILRLALGSGDDD